MYLDGKDEISFYHRFEVRSNSIIHDKSFTNDTRSVIRFGKFN